MREGRDNDPSFGSLWGLHNTGQSGGSNDADIDAPEGWDAAGLGSFPSTGGVKVGMLSGQDQTRPRTASRERSRDGGKLDCLGPGADDQPNVRGLQASP